MTTLTNSGRELVKKIKCANRDTERNRKDTIGALVECMTSHGYKEYEPKYHFNGRHSNITLTLSDNGCQTEGCRRPNKILYNWKSGQVTKGCLDGACPAKIFAVELDEEGMTMSVLHYSDVDTRRSTMTGVQHLHGPTVKEGNHMVELAHTRGLPMAHEIYKRHGDAGQDLYPTDVFDGSVWWFYDTHKHIWRVDKSGAHIHQTVYDTIKKEWGSRVCDSTAQKEAMDQLVRDAALRLFRNNMVADCTVAFIDREFKRKLDSNMSLLGCKNGVYDYNMGKLRPGRPSDYITKSTGRTFIDRNVDLQDIPLINKFFTDVLVQADVIDCVLCALCLSMRGVPLSKFWMWTGEGANGKSKLASLY